ncbi:unnamed protein product [Rotaria sp. Silwood1]|nr:unnamed protein product [Rotaria sp. Silwood1]CAF1682587.1 unnamed protein product [Rotaria sp. Silwood1]CAF3849327.1 unnamed protein product [Rotaria sp. Silwood1]CAF3926674.1 unnamed protein product [Rotaria sp. Silwood1]CAF4599469.1 unnamed protein product [Rotaria sp. Silwood1]
MGCKQCKIFTTKHENYKTKSTIIEQNSISIPNNEPTQILSNKINSNKQIKFTTIDSSLLPTLDNLPVELIYYILKQLDTYTIFTSLYNVCSRLNLILHTYDQYDLNLNSISMSYFYHICSLINPGQIISLTLSDGNDNIGLVKLFLKKFPIESFKRLHSLTLVNIDNNEQMIKIFLSITDQLEILSIKNTNEYYNDTFIDILMTSLEKKSLYKIYLDIEKNRFLNSTIIWPDKCFLKEIKLIGFCNITLFRTILINSPYLKKFQAYDIDLDDEWIDDDDDDDDDDDEIEQHQMLPILNTSNLISLSLVYTRNEMEKIEWLLTQFTQLKYFKYLNIYDFSIESIYESDYSLVDGQRWEKILYNYNQFEFIFTIHMDDEAWNFHNYLPTFQTKFWQDKNWNIAYEQYDRILLIYSLPYPHDTHYYDCSTFFSIAYNPFLLNKSLQNVTKLRINMTAVNNLEKRVSKILVFCFGKVLIIKKAD